MNIFILNEDPEIAAQELCDKHVVKMILETAQMLCSAFPQGEAPYKRTHYNHPCSVWTRKSLDNFNWLITHGLEMCYEYTRRYGKVHKSQAVIEWCELNKNSVVFPTKGLTTFAQAMPDQYKHKSAVEAYRRYYRTDKKSFAVWNHSEKPSWF
tara:strand:+ start:2751 stop:3209 length:459 start_codon:yes stop_codon:yes gene_type:complete